MSEEALRAKWKRIDYVQQQLRTAATWVRRAEHFARDADASTYEVDQLVLLMLDTVDTLTQVRTPEPYFESDGPIFGLDLAPKGTLIESYEFERMVELTEALAARLKAAKKNAATMQTIIKLESVEGRTPAEAELYRRKAAELRRGLLEATR